MVMAIKMLMMRRRRRRWRVLFPGMETLAEGIEVRRRRTSVVDDAAAAGNFVALRC